MLFIINFDMSAGMCRVLGSCMDKVFIMKVMNEEASHKYQAVWCEASADGDFLGVVSESKSVAFFITLDNCEPKLDLTRI